MDDRRPQILVLGAGFGGLNFCESFPHDRAHVTVVDCQNHHLFQPLLYQVASAGLAAPDIAQPVRSILSDKRNVTVLLDRVTDFQLDQRKVVLEKNVLSYDYLIVALGGVTSYFGHPEWEEIAPGLKTLEDALRIRRQVLLAFERAEDEGNPERVKELLTIVVVGGGPTGVELAGAFAELARFALRRDFRRIDPRKSRIILIEGGPRVLPQFPEELSTKARQQLERLGVEVRLGASVKAITKECVELEGSIVRAANIIWAAGVSAHPLGAKLGAPKDRAGRIKVQHDLSIPGHSEVFVIGDMASVPGSDGKPVPGVAPAAMQMAHYVSALVASELKNPKQPRQPFRYHDKGNLATIGRSSAVAQIGKLRFSGFPAWFAWLAIHLLFLIGFRNRISVLVQWTYSYFTFKRGARIITGPDSSGKPSKVADEQ